MKKIAAVFFALGFLALSGVIGLVFSQDGGRCTTVMDCAQKAMEAAFQAKTAIRVAVPKGAVMAFDLETCPEGWEPFDRLSGRVVMGTGQRDGSGLSARKLGETGGEERHHLTVDEMPSHAHRITTLAHWGDRTNGQPGLGGDDGTFPASIGTDPAGGDKPHNILPPYYVLTYCKRT
ncbi:hypothetical protein FS763_01490 [Agrobacterium vitis]|uniref:hypothetical protein n=1 Tax=Allorhizobium ampelinum TaxID=3025782 RepID=UPI001F21B933|nr:hypothetical protein [Allorhizobium ampelinum]MCF1470603.1 hypothetical protein [Allorhizobium ampelinum]